MCVSYKQRVSLELAGWYLVLYMRTSCLWMESSTQKEVKFTRKSRRFGWLHRVFSLFLEDSLSMQVSCSKEPRTGEDRLWNAIHKKMISSTTTTVTISPTGASSARKEHLYKHQTGRLFRFIKLKLLGLVGLERGLLLMWNIRRLSIKSWTTAYQPSGQTFTNWHWLLFADQEIATATAKK